MLGNAAMDMKWLYIGESGSGSATHRDTNNSSAWLWVAAGEKEWVCAHAADSHLLRSRRGDGGRAAGAAGAAGTAGTAGAAGEAWQR